ncbi:MAG: hypothetical protein EXS32_05540 [Opitutus sp.]|nr:hypothetical protein [Opitutus sp.]
MNLRVFRRSVARRGFLFVPALWFCVAAAAAQNPRTILFVDDADVLYRPGTIKRIGAFAKAPGNPVLRPTKPWESTIGWMSVGRSPATGRFQMWYQARAPSRKDEDKRFKHVVCYAESEDGLHWDKPDLGLFPFYGERATNIVMIGNGGLGDRYCCSVLIEPGERDPALRYKMAYYDWAAGERERDGAGTHFAFSSDGIRWTKEGGLVIKTAYGAKGPPAPFRDEGDYFEEKLKDGSVRKTWRSPMTMSDAADLIFDPRRETYVLYGKMWIPGPDGGLSWKHAMGRTESRDLRQWSKPELVLTTNDRDPPMLEFHTSPVFCYNGQYFSLNQIMDRAAGSIDLELMSSRDGLRWERDFANLPVFPRGEGRVFDAGSVKSNCTPIVLPEEIRFYYSARRGSSTGGVGFDQQVIGSDDIFSGVGLASIRRDRFVSVEPDLRSRVSNANPTPGAAAGPVVTNHLGQVTLRPLDLRGVTAITVNADAAAGAVRVEILDEDGYRVRGFTRDEAVPLRGDGLALAAAWRERRLSDLPPGRYLLRLHLDRARLFACTLR